MDFGLSPDQVAFVEGARKFARDVVAECAAEIDDTARFPRALVTAAGEAGLCGMTVPASAGGAGRDYVSYALAMEEIAAASATLAVILTVNTSLVAEPIALHGTEEQRGEWLPGLIDGTRVGAFALSEAGAGSDAANQQTLAVSDDDGYLLSGRKVWVANAEAADVAIVLAATNPAKPGRGITAFLVPLDSSGIECEPCDSLGVRGLGCMDMTLTDVRVPATAVLGGAGRGLAIAFRALERGRVAIAAQALGVGFAALDEALAYARQHEAFGQPIGQFQAIQFQLADLAADLEAARLLTWRAADAHDRATRAGVEAAMAKLQASEAAHRAADRAMQILASAGYRRGSRIERLLRDIRAAEIYQGTSEVQRMIIAEQVVRGNRGIA
ncbi:MAG: acyl-CoA dehydrogenase family protein [Acidobacteriota bacterium]